MPGLQNRLFRTLPGSTAATLMRPAILLISYALLVSGLILVLGSMLPVDQPAILALLVLVLVVLLNPVYNHFQRLLGRISDQKPEARAGQLQAIERAVAQGSDLGTVLNTVRSTLQQELAPRHTHIFLFDPESKHYADTPLAGSQFGSDLRFSAESLLAGYLDQERAPLILEKGDSVPESLKPDSARLSLLDAQVFIPMSGQHSLVGWLALAEKESGEHYSRTELDFLVSVARQAALAAERVQAVADLEQRVHELNVLTRLADGINVTLAFDDLLELFCTQINQLIPTRDLRVILRDDPGGPLYPAFVLENDIRLTNSENRPLADRQGLEEVVVRGQRSILTDDYTSECKAHGVLPADSGLYAWIGVPLNAGAGTIGALSLGSRDPAVLFTDRQAHLLEAIAGLAAGAIVKTRLLEETERRAHQLQTLNEIAKSLTSTLDLDAVLHQIVESAMDLLGCEAGSLLLVDESTGESVFKVALGPVGDNLVGQRLPAEVGLVGKAISTGLAIIQNDVRRSKEWYDADSRTGYHTQDLLVVPLQVKERVIGALEVLNKRDGSTFTQADQDLLSGFAGPAAIAIENAGLYTLTDQALADRVEELSVMQRIDRELNASLDLARAMRITLDWALRQSMADAGLVGLLTDEGVRVIASQGYPVELNGAVLPTLNGSDSQEAPALPAQLPGARSQLALPIYREARVVGLLQMESQSKAGFTNEVKSFLARLSDHAAIAIANAQLYEAVQAASLAKSQFVSAAAHELKNPLTSIKGYSDLLVAGVVGPVSEGQANFLSTIRSNADRMSILVSDLQDLSRIEAGQLRLKFSAVPVAPLVEEVVHTLRRQIDEKEQTLELSMAEDLPLVWADRDRLIQILTNLVSNAHKYMPRNGSLFIHAEPYAGAEKPEILAQFIHFLVRDNGIGMSPEDQKKVFQQFFRSEDPRVREVSGTGLGLSITKNLVEMQGGQIWFESTVGSGTEFHFTVPVAVEPNSG